MLLKAEHSNRVIPNLSNERIKRLLWERVRRNSKIWCFLLSRSRKSLQWTIPRISTSKTSDLRTQHSQWTYWATASSSTPSTSSENQKENRIKKLWRACPSVSNMALKGKTKIKENQSWLLKIWWERSKQQKQEDTSICEH